MARHLTISRQRRLSTVSGTRVSIGRAAFTPSTQFASAVSRLISSRLLSSAASSPLWEVNPWTGLVSNSRYPTEHFQVIVGLEIHAQLQIPTKLFSPAISQTSRVNDLRALHPFDLAVPGTLPQLSANAVQKAVLVAAALQCEIHDVSRFERKHYAYADLPASYQITQQRWPLASAGMIECDWNRLPRNNKYHLPPNHPLLQQPIRCGVQRIQLEQDTGKTTTRKSTQNGVSYSRVDFTRAGCALVEIVLAPDLRSSLQAASVVRTLLKLLQVTQTCDGRMQDGHLRVDCNVNIRKVSATTTTTTTSAAAFADADPGDNLNRVWASPRIEVKNLSSIQQVRESIQYEACRAAEAYVSGQAMDGEETRTWNVLRQETELIRRKDQSPDYRFLPEPDLPALVLRDCLGPLDEFLRDNLPELPSATFLRLQKEPYMLSDYQARNLCSDPVAVRLLEEAVARVLELPPVSDTKQKNVTTADIAKTAANFLDNELTALAKGQAVIMLHQPADDEGEFSMSNVQVTGVQLGDVIHMLVIKDSITATMAKKLLHLLHEASDPALSVDAVAKQHGLQLEKDYQVLKQLCQDQLQAHPDALELYRRGGKYVRKIKKFVTGEAMAASRGNAHPELLKDALDDVLNEVAPGVQ